MLLLIASPAAFSVASNINHQPRFVTEIMSPFQLKKEGKLTGFAVEIVNDIQTKMNLSHRIEVYPWARAYAIAEKEPNVFIFTLVKTPERMEKFNWIGEYYVATDSFYALSSRKDIVINSIEDAKRYNTCIPRNDVGEQHLINYGFAEKRLKKVAFQSQCLGMLHRDRVDLILFNEQGVRSLANKLNIPRSDFKRVFIVSEAVMGIAASKNTDPQLIADVRQTLSQVKSQASYSIGLNKWFNSAQQPTKDDKN